eukprot:3929328-Pyramimonas_sp.AAC.1
MDVALAFCQLVAILFGRSSRRPATVRIHRSVGKHQQQLQERGVSSFLFKRATRSTSFCGDHTVVERALRCCSGAAQNPKNPTSPKLHLFVPPGLHLDIYSTS